MSEQKNTPPLPSIDDLPINGMPWPSSATELVEQVLRIGKQYAQTNLTDKELEALVETYPINHGQDIKTRRQRADYKDRVIDMMKPLPPMGG